MNVISHDLKIIPQTGSIRGRFEIIGDNGAHTGHERSFGNLVKEQAALVKWIVKQTEHSEERAEEIIAEFLVDVRNGQDYPDPEDEPVETPEPSAWFPGLVDIVEDDDGEPAFLIRNPDGSLTTTTETAKYTVPDRNALPWLLPRDEQVRKYYVVDTIAEVYRDLLAYHRWASKLDDHYYPIIALHDILTYLQEKVQYFPQIEFASSDPERGKSRQGQSMAHVSYRGIITETMREPNLFRWSDSLHATIFFDVRDPWTKALKRGSDDALLGRFDRHGAKVARIHEPGLNPLAGGTTYYSAYGPTIYAVNEAMPDPMGSRCIPIVPPQASGRWPDLTPAHGLPYRERLVALAARIYPDDLPDVPKPLDGRLGDILHGLARIARLIGDDVYQSFLKSAHQVHQERQSERGAGPEAKIIEALVLAAPSEGLVLQGPSALLVGGDVRTKAILDVFNDGLPERRQLSPEAMGKKLRALGFPAGTRSRSERTRTVDAMKLQQLALKYNVLPPEEPGEPGEPGGNQADTGSNSPPGEEPPTEPGGNLAEPQEDSLTPEYDLSTPGTPGAPGLTPPMEEEKQEGFELEIEEPWDRYLEERDANRSPAN